MRPIIAIDGPAGAGKSSVARLLAERLGYRFLDTGALYRAVTLMSLRRGLDPSDEDGLAALARGARIELRTRPGSGPPEVFLDGEDVSAEIRGPAVTNAVSRIAALPGVRAAMLRFQREFAARGGVVAEGRDIGTVVFPDAGLKFFLDADPAVRARRRASERPGEQVEQVQAEIDARDHADTSRAVAPLKPAHDAQVVDTTGLGLEEVVALLERAVQRR